jgi:preprotein translocase subunit SecA
LHWFGLTSHSLTADVFDKLKPNELTPKLYKEVLAYYRERCTALNQNALPVFEQMHAQFGSQLENVVVPLTDGKRTFQVVVNVEKAIESQGTELSRTIEKLVTLGFIDQLWKEHLRDMDDLKQASNNAYIEQKDPLLVYKFEALELFKVLVYKISEEVLTFLFKVEIVQQEDEPQPVRQVRPPAATSSSRIRTSRDEEEALAVEEPVAAPVKREPIVKSGPAINRNDRVSVRYANGELRKDVKYKTVEDDIKNNLCVIVDLS